MNANITPVKRHKYSGYTVYITRENQAKLKEMSWIERKMNLSYLFMVEKNGVDNYSYWKIASNVGVECKDSRKRTYTPVIHPQKLGEVPTIHYHPNGDKIEKLGFIQLDGDCMRLSKHEMSLYLGFISYRNDYNMVTVDTLIRWAGLEAYLREHKRKKTILKIKQMLVKISGLNRSQLSYEGKEFYKGKKLHGFEIITKRLPVKYRKNKQEQLSFSKSPKPYTWYENQGYELYKYKIGITAIDVLRIQNGDYIDPQAKKMGVNPMDIKIDTEVVNMQGDYALVVYVKKKATPLRLIKNA